LWTFEHEVATDGHGRLRIGCRDWTQGTAREGVSIMEPTAAQPTLVLNLSDGVQRALGREPRDFTDYARAAATGVWNGSAAAA
jgi:hypothetical protein